jgi:hypothetical protein
VPAEVLLLICDGRSEDSTAEIVRAFGAKAAFPVQVHVNAERLGWTKNFEKAIGHAFPSLPESCWPDATSATRAGCSASPRT